MSSKSRTESTVVYVAAATATALISVSLISPYKRREHRVQNDKSFYEVPYPPTPPSRHWLLGHALALQPTLPNKPKVSHDVTFFEWMQKLQSKVVMFELPVVGRMIVVGDPDIARYLLVTRNFRKSPTYNTLLPLIGKSSLIVAEGKTWALQRKLYTPGFSPDFLRSVVSTIVGKCDRFIAKCDTDIRNGTSTDMMAQTIELTSDVIAQVAFGEDWGGASASTSKGQKTLNTIRALVDLVGGNMTNPLQRYFGWRSMWKTWRLSRALNRDMQDLVNRRLDKLCSTNRDSDQKKQDILSLTLSSVLASRKSSNPNVASSLSARDMESITSQLKSFYFAGHDTTSTTISWAYWLLVQHPVALKRARDEVLQNLGQSWSEEALHGSKLGATTYEMLQKCEYLDAITRETLRLYPPGATTRFATDPDASFGGFRLGDSDVHLNVYAMQRDPDVWGELCNAFVPERFLGESGKRWIASYSFLPFSKGSRDCIGKYFSLLEIKVALAALICRYDASVVDSEEVYGARLTSIPLGGCKVNLRLRKAT